jgi:hypothetical protein
MRGDGACAQALCQVPPCARSDSPHPHRQMVACCGLESGFAGGIGPHVKEAAADKADKAIGRGSGTKGVQVRKVQSPMSAVAFLLVGLVEVV